MLNSVEMMLLKSYLQCLLRQQAQQLQWGVPKKSPSEMGQSIVWAMSVWNQNKLKPPTQTKLLQFNMFQHISGDCVSKIRVVQSKTTLIVGDTQVLVGGGSPVHYLYGGSPGSNRSPCNSYRSLPLYCRSLQRFGLVTIKWLPENLRLSDVIDAFTNHLRQ